MLTDRELIEHWHLRDVAQALILAIGALALMALAFAIAGIWWRFLWVLAAGVTAAALTLGLWLRRVWRRLEELEGFLL